MILYTVTYKQLKPFSIRKKIRKVKGDGLTESGVARFFIREDETRIEIPVSNTIFKFSKERFDLIKERMEIEVGQPIKVVPR